MAKVETTDTMAANRFSQATGINRRDPSEGVLYGLGVQPSLVGTESATLFLRSKLSLISSSWQRNRQKSVHQGGHEERDFAGLTHHGARAVWRREHNPP